MNNFWNPHHEALFAMFILESNQLIRSRYIFSDDWALIQRAMLTYYNQWEDRATCPIEYEGIFRFPHPYKPFFSIDKKVKYRYED